MAHTVRVDKDLCISSGKCVADFPRAFRFDDDEISEATENASSLTDDEMVEAARNCPSGAIAVLDEQGDEVDVW